MLQMLLGSFICEDNVLLDNMQLLVLLHFFGHFDPLLHTDESSMNSKIKKHSYLKWKSVKHMLHTTAIYCSSGK